jgi:hypothetical protein
MLLSNNAQPFDLLTIGAAEPFTLPSVFSYLGPMKLTLVLHSIYSIYTSGYSYKGQVLNRRSSSPTTGGVNTTAKAKLKISASRRPMPHSKAVEIVAPDRENPRKGKPRLCTTPISMARRPVIG